MVRRLFSHCAVLALAGVLAASPGAAGSERLTVAEALAARKNHAVFYIALKESGELDALSGPGPYTLFAPTDAVFVQFDNATLKKLIGDKEYLKRMVRGHIVAGKHPVKDLKERGEVKTLAGTTLKVVDGPEGLRVGRAKLVVTDIECRNGVIHVIDVVLLPDG